VSYQASRIADYLHRHEHASQTAADRAARAIAKRWNDREFWQAAILDPLTRCANASPGMPPVVDVLARLVRRFGTHVHDVPAWEPRPPRTPASRPAIAVVRQIEDNQATPHSGQRSPRVLVTGSRTWTDHTVIRAALAATWQPDAVLVSGGCPRGADRLCEQCWHHWGGQIEQHPADWQRHGRTAGYLRNQHMVTLGADLCLAFIRDHSPGATHCADTAERTGIPTRRYHHQTRRTAA
jgi:SLOG family YspA-like protein